MAKKKKAKKPTRRVDKDWEALKKAFREAGKGGGEKDEKKLFTVAPDSFGYGSRWLSM